MKCGTASKATCIARQVIGIAFVFLIGLGAAQAQKHIWNLSKDIRATKNQISFSQGSDGVWYFMHSSSFVHDPLTYSFLPEYAEHCLVDPLAVLIDGLACHYRFNPADPGHHTPYVAFNFTDSPLYPMPGFEFPSRVVFMHPGPDQLVIIAWKSRDDARVRVTGMFHHLGYYGNGVRWSIERGKQALKSGDLVGDVEESFNLQDVHVSKNQVLYFIVDPKADYGGDSTLFDVTIAEEEHER